MPVAWSREARHMTDANWVGMREDHRRPHRFSDLPTRCDVPASDLKLVAGLDLARRSDHSALVLLDVEADRLTVSAALRLPQAPLRQQFTLITAPRWARPPRLDQSGLTCEDTNCVAVGSPLQK